jgi:hypothetical protein
MIDQEKYRKIGERNTRQELRNELSEKRFEAWWKSLSRMERKHLCEASAEGGWNQQRKHAEEELDEALDALVSMMDQYCIDGKTEGGKPKYDHVCMYAGEGACDVLLKHGRISIDQLTRL